MVDDDINKFYKRPPVNNDKVDKVDRKLHELSVSQILNNGEKFVKLLEKKDINTVFQIGFKKGAFGLLDSTTTVNTDIGEIHMLNARRLKDIDYDLNMIALEDTDLCVRNIIKGNQNIKLNHFIFYAPKSGTGKRWIRKCL